MARRSARGGASAKREAKAKSKKKAVPVAEVEVVEEGKGLGIDDGIVIMTTILFLAAFVLTDYTLGTGHAEGLFFK